MDAVDGGLRRIEVHNDRDLADLADLADHDELDLPDSLDAPRVAREFVAARSCGWEPPADSYVLVLLTSELVTNAVQHSAHPRRLLLSCPDPGHVRVEVTDSGTALPVLTSFGPTGEGGRGLSLVDQLADSWGHEATSGGKRIWFVLPRPRRPSLMGC